MRYFKILAVILSLFCFSGLLLAETGGSSGNPQPEVVDSVKNPLKTRQEFNKLKRSTNNIYKVTMRSGVSFKLQTALGYVSTIDLPEPALKVFMGDQELFKVEVYEKQVLIKPISDELDARTNLIIFTHFGRLVFDVCVGLPETADFVLDFRLPEEDESLVKNAFQEKVEEKTKQLEKTYQAKEENLNQRAEKLSEEKLKEKVVSGVETLELKKSKENGEVQVNLLSLSRVADKAYLRFSILNYSKTPFKILKIIAGILTYEQKFLRKREAGLIELNSELKAPEVINPDSYEYGVLVFDYRILGKNESPVFHVYEDSTQARNIEIKDFEWFE